MKIDIIIPCYNAEKWIEESIQSALSQTYANIQIVVIDNESTDNSYEIIQRVHSENPEIIIGSAPNIYPFGWTEPVEEALSLCSGDYFTILGADDYMAPEYVDKIVQILSAAPDKIKVLQSPVLGIDSDKGVTLDEIKHSYKNLNQFKQMLFERCPVTTPTVVYKRELHDEGIIRWDSENCSGAADYDLYFNIADNGIFIYPYPKWIGYYYRWHSDQATWGMHKQTTNYDLLIKQKWLEKWNNG